MLSSRYVNYTSRLGRVQTLPAFDAAPATTVAVRGIMGAMRLTANMPNSPATASKSTDQPCVRGTRRLAGLLGLLAAAGLLGGNAGCPSSELAERRLRMRDENLRETVNTWADVEQTRPARLRMAGEYIAWNERHHAEALDRNAREAQRLLKDDVQRWQEHQPLYWKETGRILWGKPEQIENYAIIMFF